MILSATWLSVLAHKYAVLNTFKGTSGRNCLQYMNKSAVLELKRKTHKLLVFERTFIEPNLKIIIIYYYESI